MTNIVPNQALNVQQWSTGERASPVAPTLFVPVRAAYADVCHAAVGILAGDALAWVKDGQSRSYVSVGFREDLFDQSPVLTSLAPSVVSAKAGLASAAGHAFTNNQLVFMSMPLPLVNDRRDLNEFFANYHLTGINIYFLVDNTDSKDEVTAYCQGFVAYLQTVFSDMSSIAVKAIGMEGLTGEPATEDTVLTHGSHLACEFYRAVSADGWHQPFVRTFLESQGLIPQVSVLPEPDPAKVNAPAEDESDEFGPMSDPDESV